MCFSVCVFWADWVVVVVGGGGVAVPRTTVLHKHDLCRAMQEMKTSFLLLTHHLFELLGRLLHTLSVIAVHHKDQTLPTNEQRRSEPETYGPSGGPGPGVGPVPVCSGSSVSTEV